MFADLLQWALKTLFLFLDDCGRVHDNDEGKFEDKVSCQVCVDQTRRKS